MVKIVAGPGLEPSNPALADALTAAAAVHPSLVRVYGMNLLPASMGGLAEAEAGEPGAGTSLPAGTAARAVGRKGGLLGQARERGVHADVAEAGGPAAAGGGGAGGVSAAAAEALEALRLCPGDGALAVFMEACTMVRSVWWVLGCGNCTATRGESPRCFAGWLLDCYRSMTTPPGIACAGARATRSPARCHTSLNFFDSHSCFLPPDCCFAAVPQGSLDALMPWSSPEPSQPHLPPGPQGLGLGNGSGPGQAEASSPRAAAIKGRLAPAHSPFCPSRNWPAYMARRALLSTALEIGWVTPWCWHLDCDAAVEVVAMAHPFGATTGGLPLYAGTVHPSRPPVNSLVHAISLTHISPPTHTFP